MFQRLVSGLLLTNAEPQTLVSWSAAPPTWCSCHSPAILPLMLKQLICYPIWAWRDTCCGKMFKPYLASILFQLILQFSGTLLAFVKQLAVSGEPTSTIPGGERLLIPHRHQRALAGSEEGGEETAVIQSRPPSQNEIKCRSAQPCLTSSSVYYRMTAITQRCGWKSATYKHKGCHTERGVCVCVCVLFLCGMHEQTLTH